MLNRSAPGVAPSRRVGNEQEARGKDALIEIPAPADVPASALLRTRKVVGGMAEFVTTQTQIYREAEELRKVVESSEGAKIVRALHPSQIAPSDWANRHDDTFHLDDFTELKREIKESGGTV